MKWPICGPKLSLCCSVISVWGIIQFILLGIFFFVQSAPLLDDFDIDTKNFADDPNAFNAKIKDAFQKRAVNCWIAAVLYVALLIFAGMQFRTHLQKSPTSNIPPPGPSSFAGVTTEENGHNSQYGIQFSRGENEK